MESASTPNALDFQAPEESRAEVMVRRILRVPDMLPKPAQSGAAERLFSFAMILSGLRCTLSYVIVPFLLPALGLGAVAGVGPAIGIPIGVAALYFDVKGIRRFWIARHRWRWQMTGIYLAVISLVLYLVTLDLIKIL